jgi:hypothetical protein
MKRIVNFQSWKSILLGILFCTAMIASLVLRWMSANVHFGYGLDLERARAVLQRVRLGESRCYQSTGRFASLEDLGPGRCGGLDRKIASGADNGFTVEVHAAGDQYSVKVHPKDAGRYYSLYSDQTEVIHFGSRYSPASPDSPLQHYP